MEGGGEGEGRKVRRGKGKRRMRNGTTPNKKLVKGHGLLCHDGRCLSVRLFVSLSVCPVPNPKSRMEGRSKLKIDRREVHDTGDS